MGRQPDGMGNVPISIITTGGQTYAVASNLHTGMYSQGATAMQIRPIAPNAAAVVQANSLSVQQIRTNIPRIATVGKSYIFPIFFFLLMFYLFIKKF